MLAGMSSLLDELGSLLPPDQIVSDPAELFVYEREGFTLAHARPAAVVFPTDISQVSQVVQLLARHGVPIVPRGSGTGLTGGCVAFANGVIISTVRMNRILVIDLANRAAHVEAGVRNTALSDAVAALPGGNDFHFAPDPSSQRATTIGGNASTNAGGIHTLKDFVTSNHIYGMQMVLADGSVLEVGGRNGGCETAAFDLPGLICGHEGTFGIVTELWVRLTAKPAAFRTAVCTFASSRQACDAVTRIITAGILPAAMEMMDGPMIQAVEDAFHFGFRRDAQALLLIEIDGIDQLLDHEMSGVVDLCRAAGAVTAEQSADPQRRTAMWKARKSAFGALGRLSHSYCTQDACVPRSKLGEVLDHVAVIGKKFGLRIFNCFHAGDGNVHPIFLYDDRDESQVQNTLLACEEVLKYCIDIGGTLTGEHGVGVEKLPLMTYLFDEPTMRQFAAVKAAFDPEERLNAGKLLPSEKINVRLLKPGRHVPQ